MNFIQELIVKSEARLGKTRPQGRKVRLRVSNVTRKTVLASGAERAGHGESRRKGLLGRKGLLAGEGLWIVPCEAVHTIGMQFPIDLVYVDKKLQVKKIRSSVGPWRISACFTAHSVLELPSGTIRETLTRVGDHLEVSPVDAESVG
jgi:uncharacterized membrane protein (UPF0127 family)